MPLDARDRLTIEQRREQVAQLYLAGANQTAIAKQLGISQPTVVRDIQYVKAMWKESQIEAMDDAVTRHLTELDFIREQLRNDYANSKSITTLKELIRVQEREAKLLGLDAPVKQVTNHSPQRIEIVFGDQDAPTDYA